ncbi:LCP family protein [Oerskovia flava]|uniref:LCP family protein n=1 Tax=Oerskovia flava TaxID=2986422 RepID=UPI00223F6130|nr:LCP family protein [Oerskovia sp. JB1-3-2]
MTSPHRSRRAAAQSTAAPESTKGPSHARALGGRTALRSIGLVATALFAFVSVGAASAYSTLQGNIKTAQIDDLLGERPEEQEPTDPNAGKAMNILVLGSDFRGGENTDFAVEGVEGMRSDTTLLVHVSADRSRVEMLSIPRDSRVDIPSCTATNGKTTAPVNDRFNAAFAQGYDLGGDLESAAACAVKTVESLTDVRINDFVVVDFTGFQNMVDAIDGVPICIPVDIDSPKADHLKLSAGKQTLDGKTALSYARARTGQGLGDGSDLGRIARQQELLAATVRQVLSKNLLTDAQGLFQFLEAGTSSLTMSEEIASIPHLAGVAYSLRGLSGGNITFMTVPIADDPLNPRATVVWTPEADEIWDRLRADEPITGEPAEPEEAAAPPSGGAGSVESDDSTGASEGASDDSTEPTTGSTDEPSPRETKEAGKEAFTPDDITAECG